MTVLEGKVRWGPQYRTSPRGRHWAHFRLGSVRVIAEGENVDVIRSSARIHESIRIVGHFEHREWLNGEGERRSEQRFVMEGLAVPERSSA